MVDLELFALEERIKQSFSSAGGSNSLDEFPLNFNIKGAKREDQGKLRPTYSRLFADIAKAALGQPYQPSLIPFDKQPNRARLAIHPNGANVRAVRYDHFFNQMAYDYDGDLPIIDVSDYNNVWLREQLSNIVSGRKKEYHVFLRLVHGTSKNKLRLFTKFEELAQAARIPYLRSDTQTSIADSLNMSISFIQALDLAFSPLYYIRMSTPLSTG